MKYDFDTVIPRGKLGSSKWYKMKDVVPDLPEDIVPFSVADMELLNAPQIIEGLKKYLDETVLGYAYGTDSYYEAVCGWMKRRHNWEVQKDWIVLTPGVVPSFFVALSAFCRPGEGVIVQTPVYYPFYKAIEANGNQLVRNPLKYVEGRYEMDFEDLEAKAKDPNTTAIIFCSPHNPSCRVWRKEELERFAKICIENNVLIISDEIHFDLIAPGYKHTVLANISEEIAKHTITCTAPSKSFNIAGMQASNIIISDPELRERYAKECKDFGFTQLNVLGYKACEIAYNECEDWFEEVQKVINRNSEMLVAFLQENIPEIKPVVREGTYLQWMDCRDTGMTAEELEHFMKHEAHWFLDEGYVFGEEGRGFERINLACPTRVLEAALERLKKAWAARK